MRGTGCRCRAIDGGEGVGWAGACPEPISGAAREEPKEIDGGISIVRAQLIRDRHTLLGGECAIDERHQVMISGFPSESADTTLRELRGRPTRFAFVATMAE
jgi:hypothetical protein